MNERIWEGAEGVLLHEMQHLMQSLDGTPQGSSEGYWKQERKKRLGRLMEAMERKERSLAAMLLEDPDAFESQAYREEAAALLALKEAYHRLAERTAQELYWNTAGEIEARDTARRRSLTAQERRQTPPKAADENTVFEEENGGDSLHQMERGEKINLRHLTESMTAEQADGRQKVSSSKMKTSDLSWNLKQLKGVKAVESKVKWRNEIPECNEELLNEVHSNLNRTMIEEHVEMLSIIEKGGRTAYYQKGKEIDEVILSKETLQKLKNAPDDSIIFSHAHPGKTSFSKEDIRKIIDFPSISTLTIECSNAEKFILKRGAYKSSLFGRLRFDTWYSTIYDEVAKSYPELNDHKKIYDVWDDFLFEVNSAVAKKYGFVFRRIK